MLRPRPYIKRRIALVGVELEGGWKTVPNPNNNPSLGRRVTDTSVQVYGEYQAYRGEYVSRPLRPSKIPAWIEANNPDYVNETCGMHVHISTRSPYHYSRLMEVPSNPVRDRRRKDYASYLLGNLKRWGERMRIEYDPFWDRLDGQNTHYCATSGIDPMAQATAKAKTGDRYRAINYCYALHGTVEIRVLPAFPDKLIAASAVRFILAKTEQYLQRLPRQDTENIESEITAEEAIADIMEWKDPYAPSVGEPIPIPTSVLDHPGYRAGECNCRECLSMRATESYRRAAEESQNE